MFYSRNLSVSELVGKTVESIQVIVDEIRFRCSDGSIYKMYHDQECCESVSIEDDYANSKEGKEDARWGSYTWTFYKFATKKGYVDVRWYGSSNGYYSESVDFVRVYNKNN